MKGPKFFVGYPKALIEKRPWFHKDNITFYNNIQRILDDFGYEYNLGDMFHVPFTHDIILAYHTHSVGQNIWNLKKSYIPGYMYWDRCGYSGWAEITDSKKLFEESQNIDILTARRWLSAFSDNYIKNGISKFPQKKTGLTAIPPDNTKFSVEGPYVFVACQRPSDIVSKLAYIDTRNLAEYVSEAFQGTDYKVIIKLHPQEAEMSLDHLSVFPHVIFSQHSIHEIIPDSSAVFVVNSGVGFEALLHNKLVYTSGRCDYHWATRVLSHPKQLKDIDKKIREPFDLESNIKFSYYMLKRYFVEVSDYDAIERRITYCVDEWKSRRRGLSRFSRLFRSSE